MTEISKGFETASSIRKLRTESDVSPDAKLSSAVGMQRGTTLSRSADPANAHLPEVEHLDGLTRLDADDVRGDAAGRPN
jgi:hypothetical protein